MADNQIPKQPELFTRYWPRGAAPARAQVLELLSAAVPWGGLEELVRPLYQADARKRGRRGHALKLLLRCQVLAIVWRASDRALAAAIVDSRAFGDFLGLDPRRPAPPSASALRNFAAVLEKALDPDGVFTMAQHLDFQVRAAIAAAGLEWRAGAITEPIFRRRRA